MSFQPPPVFELETKTIGQITGVFSIKAYQRGYRWRPEEVAQLLDDINRQSSRPYCLQPVVVKRSGVEEYELVDGQQRLTTIHLVLHHLRTHIPTLRPRFTLSYETRPDTVPFLADPGAVNPELGIDAWFIKQAYLRIEKWFAARPDPALTAMHLYPALMERTYVIWYVADASVNPAELFARLNAGRIRLTNAELVRALFLKRDPSAEGGDAARSESLRQFELAAQWDGLERDLQDDAFWAFLTNEPAEEYACRIELLLRWTTGQTEPDPKASDFALFEWFDAEMKKPSTRADGRRRDEVWEQVADLHQLLREWYLDPCLYHRIGFLLHDGTPVLPLIAEARCGTKSAFHDGLALQIRDRLKLTQSGLRGLTYQHPRSCHRALLLFNVETVRTSPDPLARFPFAAHKPHRGWSLEHIHARQGDPLKGERRWRAWLELHSGSLGRLSGLDPSRREVRDQLLEEVGLVIDGEVTELVFTALRRRMLDLFGDAGEGEEVDAISNLALLERDDNSALSNAEFDAKRRKVVALESTKYVPICTRRAFAKFYTETAPGVEAAPADSTLQYWSRNDREAYLAAMIRALDPFLTRESE